VIPSRQAAWRDRRLTPLGFRLDGREYLIPDPPARVWVLAVLSDEEADLLLDLLQEEEAEDLWDAALDPDSDVTMDLLVKIGRQMLTAASGRPWWKAQMLVAQLVEDWEYLDARAADRALGDPLSWNLERLCSWVYLRITEHATKEERARIDARLDTPPIPTEPLGEDEVPEGWEDEASGWEVAAAQLGHA